MHAASWLKQTENMLVRSQLYAEYEPGICHKVHYNRATLREHTYYTYLQ